MYYWVRFTGERITEESAANGDVAERGWIDPVFSWHELFDAKNDARAYRFDSLDEVLDFIHDEIGDTEDIDGDTFYAVDSRQDFETGDYWNYAAHIETTG